MEKVDGKELQYPVMLRFVVLSPDQSSESFYRYMIQPWTYRSGTLRVDGHIVPFELRGSTGIYNKPSNAIWLDLDGDGQGGADYKYKQSKEYFTVRDEHVNIGDTSYKFEVDKFGRTLTLTPVDKPLPERPSLEPGTEAPGLQAPGMDGKQQSLGRYEGRVILLDFWYTTCPPCIKEAPRLAELHKQHGDGDLQILGISPDNEAAVREFTDRYDHDWPQVLEPYEGPIHRDYRVLAYPAKFLIDRDGDILCSGTAKFWERCESKLVDVLNR